MNELMKYLVTQIEEVDDDKVKKFLIVFPKARDNMKQEITTNLNGTKMEWMIGQNGLDQFVLNKCCIQILSDALVEYTRGITCDVLIVYNMNELSETTMDCFINPLRMCADVEFIDCDQLVPAVTKSASKA